MQKLFRNHIKKRYYFGNILREKELAEENVYFSKEDRKISN